MKIRGRELEVPIIQGGMGVGVSLGNLAGAVAANGAVGVISSVNAGYREADFDRKPVEANLRALTQEIKHALSLAEGRGLVAVNIMVAVNHYEETVKTAIEAGVQAIISGAGMPMELPKYAGDADVALAPIVSSGKAAKLLCMQWDKKYDRIPDFIVIEGPGAGGHLGFKKEEILEGTAKKPIEILPEVLKAIKEFEDKYNKKIPVFTGGGVFDGHDMAAMLSSGASGVQIGTRFIATKECDASQAYKEMMIKASGEDVVIVQSPVGMPGRALRTQLIKNLEKGQQLSPQICNDCLRACPHGKKTPYCISRALIEAVKGNTEEGLFFCGENVGRVDKIVSVKELIDEIWGECQKEIPNEKKSNEENKMRRVVITGMGILSPIGNNLTENLEGLKAGKCGIAPITYFDTSECKVKVAGELKDFELKDYLPPKEVRHMDRFVALALIAAKEAVDMSGVMEYEELDKKRVGTLVATGIGGLISIEEQHKKCMEKGIRGILPFFVPGAISNIAAAKIAIEYGLRGSSSCIITACAGGTNAVGESFRMIRDGYQDVMVCGGAESCISELGIGGFSALNALSTTEDPNRASIPFDQERNGFVMGEGAGILVLEEYEHAKRRGAKILAEVAGYAANCDAYHVTAPLADGSGAADCMTLALEDAKISAAAIDYINAHGTSTKMNDSGETKAVKLAFGECAKDVLMSSTKSATGHLLGAAGAVEAIYTALSVMEEFAPATVNYKVPDEECDLNIVPGTPQEKKIEYAMTNSLGFGGHNASVIIKKY